MKHGRLRNGLALIVALALTCALTIVAPVPALAASRAAKHVLLNVTEAQLLPGRTLQMEATVLPAGASQAVKWKSSNPSIARVSSKGLITALKNGKVLITATAKNGKKKSLKLAVKMDFEGVNVRFFGVGNENYVGGELPGCISDLHRMADFYAAARFAGKPATVDAREDQTAEGMLNFLREIAANPEIGEEDITIFFYSGHGFDDRRKSIRGALAGIDELPVTVSQVQEQLDKVPGSVVVILDSCLSGQYIKQKSAGAAQATVREANAAWVTALSASKAANFSGKALGNSPVKTKYQILTACASLQSSVSMTDWATEQSYGLFTEKFLYALTTQNKKTDKNKDGIIALGEAYARTGALVKSYANAYNKRVRYRAIEMDVQVWPGKASPFPIYSSK